ncbi:type III toxin-antitoxin system ToxN/AbiQ family toxin [Veillonella magna]|nr:type III toxin-antitoxin system ToxN/AbiQ family toxin [Veillonella magna]
MGIKKVREGRLLLSFFYAEANMNLYNIDSEYLDFLRTVDKRVPWQHKIKVNRPFIGVLIIAKEKTYFAPLSSPKNKFLKMKDQIDFIKLAHGKLGAINLNNMIPVPETVCQAININKLILSSSTTEKKYGLLLLNQWEWINTNKDFIIKKAEDLHNRYIRDDLDFRVKNRCVNFPLLEKRLEQFNNKEITTKEVIPPQKPKIKISFLERTNTSKDNGKGR